jgi:uncharacterized membrane protein YuzA (DUF378 family)
VVYVALGVVTARVAFLGARDVEDGVPGALRFLLDRPHGVQILGAVVAGLVGIAAAQLVEAATGRRGALTRLGLAVNGFGYAMLAFTAARLLLRLRRGESLERAGVAWLFGEPWGARALALVGGVVAVGGLVETYQGLRGRLPFRRALLPGWLARWLSGIARFGLVARGVVLCAVGYFLIRAAQGLDPGRIRTMGGTLRAFSHTILGPAFTGIVALGLAAYGVYMWTLALLKRRV